LKNSILITLGVVTLASAGAALGVNSAIRTAVSQADLPVGEASESIDEEAQKRRLVSRSSKQQSGTSNYKRDIIHRSIFDHTKAGATLAGGITGGGESMTDLDYRLVLTMMAEPAIFSSALIAPKEGNGSGHGYGIGDKLEDATVISIEQRLIRLRRSNGQEEVLTMEEDSGGSSRSNRGKTKDLTDDEGIEKVGEHKYVVDRSLVDKYLGDLDAISKMARASPHRGTDGKIDGYRLSGVRRDSPLDKLGIKNGDVINTVNGTSLSSVSGAMGAFNSMQSESSFNFEVNRRGQDLTLDYEVR
jgi:type II secretion system protein C